jgi:hypothetical protein
MGLDISIQTDNIKEIESGDYWNPENDYLNKHSLSRTFCNLICRKDVVEGEPELNQIAQITGVNISPIYNMEQYGRSDNGGEEISLEPPYSVQSLQPSGDLKESKVGVADNIDKVLATIDDLITKLSVIDNLPELLDDDGYDTLDSKNYFSDFNIDKGEGYIGNNFGQDLRNFKRFLEFAKTKGAKTVYFSYG